MKTAEAFEFVLVANCKVGSILPKHLDLVGFSNLMIGGSFLVTSAGLTMAISG